MTQAVSPEEMRDGVPIRKGAIITTDFLEQNRDQIAKMNNFFLLYPDCFLDCIKPKKDGIDLFYYQRIYLRASMRYRYHFGTFTRGNIILAPYR